MIDIKNVKANGISFNPNYPSVQEFRPIIETAISVFRLRYSNDDILSMLNSIDNREDYYFGIRFNDNSRVADRALSAVCSTAFKDGLEYGPQSPTVEEIEMAQNSIVEFLKNIDGKTMDLLIIDAMRDCASADHWYKYEKQWD